MSKEQRPLKVFLSYASQDRPIVRELSRRLVAEGWIETWLDEKSLLPGQDWRLKIEEAVDDSDIVIICLSSNSVTKEGYVQKELRYAREIALEKPEETIFLIPLRLDNCQVPRGLRFYQWGDYFGKHKEITFRNLLRSLEERYEQRYQSEPGDTPGTLGGGGSDVEELARQALHYELSGDFWNARKTWYEIKRIDPFYPRVDIKIRELEEELRPRPEVKQKVEYEVKGKRETPKETIKKTFSKILISLKSVFPSKPFIHLRGVGFLGIIIGLFWFGLWAIPKLTALVPTAEAAATERPTIIKTSTIPPVTPPKTSTPNVATTPTKTRTPAPTALPAQITDTKNVSMVLVPAGEFIMGNDADTYYLNDDQKPAHNVFLDAFYVDQYEVTNALYKACVDAGVCKRPYNKSSYHRPLYYGNSEFDNYPVIYVDWYQAKAYCEWRDARLPTEAEWEKAAQGTNTYESNRTDTSTYGGDTAKVGSYPSGRSMYGTYDMAGNVWEWVNDWYQSDYYSTLDNTAVNPQGSDKGDSKVLRGGSWFPGGYAKGIWNEGVGPIYNRYRDFPLRYYFDTGFRCATDVP